MSGIGVLETDLFLAIVATFLTALLLRRTLGAAGSQDINALHRQVKREAKALLVPDGTDYPRWNAIVLRYTSKVGRQVLRCVKHA